MGVEPNSAKTPDKSKKETGIPLFLLLFNICLALLYPARPSYYLRYLPFIYFPSFE